jgi:hypothetical protein
MDTYSICHISEYARPDRPSRGIKHKINDEGKASYFHEFGSYAVAICHNWKLSTGNTN